MSMLPIKTVPYRDLDEWTEPHDGASFMGNYAGGCTVRVSNGTRKFLLVLDKAHDGKLYNFSARLQSDGSWVNTTRKCPEIQIIEVHEIVEAFIKVYPIEDTLSVAFSTPWDN